MSFKLINRTSVIVTPKQPFVDWLNGIPDPNFKVDGELYTVEGLKGHCTVYLIPDFDHVPDMEEFFERFKEEIFEEQLGSWYGDEAHWPKIRTAKVFGEWFDCQIDCMTYDLAGDAPLERDQD